jgi:glycosyltransferase involved in cell wall biosynthesis
MQVLPRGERPRVVLLRGRQVNPWELTPWQLLEDRYDIEVLVPARTKYDTRGLSLRQVQARTLSDLVPHERLSAFATATPLDRHLGLARHLRRADIVHAAELGFWFSAQAASRKRHDGFRLVLTVWETIPFGDSGRHRLTRPGRHRLLRETDLFLATTARARDALIVEGADPARVEIAPPGVDLARFGVEARPDGPLLISPGRLVWEKGHQDVLRALAALRRGVVRAPASASALRLLIVGAGPYEARLRAIAEDLGVADAVEFRQVVRYDDMPDLYARATAMVLASLPSPLWEEQFGMVLLEAMAAGLPIVTTTTGAIPEVVNGHATLVAAGDWLGLARALATGPLAGSAPRPAPAAELERYGLEAAARRIAAAYERVLAGA